MHNQKYTLHNAVNGAPEHVFKQLRAHVRTPQAFSTQQINAHFKKMTVHAL